MLSVDGLITGIDTESIISGLLEIQQQQIDRLELRRQEALQKQAVFGSLESQLLSLRAAAGKLSRAQGNPFKSRSVAVSNETLLIATATSQAAVGSYDLRINSLARSHQVASQGFADADAEITQGDLSLRVGGQPPVTITIDSSNNTLQGLADEINAANAGISATLVQDGSGSATPTRLLLSSTTAGSANEISITNNLAASAGGAVQPQFDLGNPVQAASNASVTLGTGSGALTVEHDTNEITGLIDGVTLNLLAADAASTVSLRVDRDVEPGLDAVRDFVTSFNDVMEFIDTQARYNGETDEGGPLLGDRTVIGIQQDLRSSILDVVPGVSSQLNRLTAVGVSVTDAGRLVLNESRLTDVLQGRVEGVSADDVRRLFALDGTSTNRNVQFLLGSSRTRASNTPYEVDLTQAAERASVTGGSALPASTVIDGSNDLLQVTIDGAAIEVNLTHGDYTPQELADQIELVLNAHPDMLGRSVSVGVAGGDLLTVTSDAYGTASRLSIDGGSALAALGLTAGQADTGVDVAGTFIVNGTVESATGRGRILAGNADNANTADLQLRITLSPAQVLPGVDAEVTVSRGLGSRLDELLNRLLDADSGRLEAVDQRYTEVVEGIEETIKRQQATFDRQQQDLIDQFVAMESAVSQLQSTAGLLSAQLAGLSGFGRG